MKYFRGTPIKFNESFISNGDSISNEIQVLRVGTFFHNGQEVEVTKKDLENMVKNFHEGVRGIDLMLDYSHESEKEAAAWFEDLFLSEDGNELWAKVDWTEDGADSVRKKKYRYISADFNFSYKDNESLKNHGPTLLGAGLTNRPVVKRMNPTILSEENISKEQKMTLEEMKKKIESMEKENKELKEKLSKKDEDKNLSEIKEREEKLAEREKAVKLSEEKIENEKKEAAKKAEFDTMLSEGKAVEAQRDAFMKDDMKAFIENAPKAGSVNFSEKGHGKEGKENKEDDKTFSESETPAQDKVISLAEKKVKEDSVDMGTAISMVLSEDAKLKDEYEKEVEG